MFVFKVRYELTTTSERETQRFITLFSASRRSAKMGYLPSGTALVRMRQQCSFETGRISALQEAQDKPVSVRRYQRSNPVRPKQEIRSRPNRGIWTSPDCVSSGTLSSCYPFADFASRLLHLLQLQISLHTSVPNPAPVKKTEDSGQDALCGRQERPGQFRQSGHQVAGVNGFRQV